MSGHGILHSPDGRVRPSSKFCEPRLEPDDDDDDDDGDVGGGDEDLTVSVP